MKSKKVAIVTWTKWNNYGTILQSYALYNIINELGYDTKVLNDKYISSSYCVSRYGEPSIVQIIKSKLQHIITNKKNDKIENIIEKREAKCNKFKQKHINYHSKNVKYKKLNLLENDFDTFICGSDQIWTPIDIFFDPYYFLDFVKNSAKISYAPSIGTSSLPNNKKAIISKMLQSFKSISVREETAKKIISELTNKPVKVCLDPTLLLSREEWIKKLNLNLKSDNKSYALCYYLGDSEWYRYKVDVICQKKKLKKIIIPWLKKDISNINPSEIIIPDPKEFLNLILNASYVFTDSFHGFIFSLLFNKNVFVFSRFSDNDNNSQNSRVKDLCEKLGLNNRYIKENDNIDLDGHIDYKFINSTIANLREDSLKFLSSNI